jgi:hypothetical protein
MCFFTDNIEIEEICKFAYENNIYETIVDMLEELKSYEYVYFEGEKYVYFDENEFLNTFKYVYDCSPQSVEHLTIDSDSIDIDIRKTVINTVKNTLPIARLTYTDAFSQDLEELIKYISEFLNCEIYDYSLIPSDHFKK